MTLTNMVPTAAPGTRIDVDPFRDLSFVVLDPAPPIEDQGVKEVFKKLPVIKPAPEHKPHADGEMGHPV